MCVTKIIHETGGHKKLTANNMRQISRGWRCGSIASSFCTPCHLSKNLPLKHTHTVRIAMSVHCPLFLLCLQWEAFPLCSEAWRAAECVWEGGVGGWRGLILRHKTHTHTAEVTDLHGKPLWIHRVPHTLSLSRQTVNLANAPFHPHTHTPTPVFHPLDHFFLILH